LFVKIEGQGDVVFIRHLSEKLKEGNVIPKKKVGLLSFLQEDVGI